MEGFDGNISVVGEASIAFIIVITRIIKPLIKNDAYLPLITFAVAVFWNVLFTWLDAGDVRIGVKIGLQAAVYASGIYSYAKATGADKAIENGLSNLVGRKKEEEVK